MLIDSSTTSNHTGWAKHEPTSLMQVMVSRPVILLPPESSQSGFINSYLQQVLLHAEHAASIEDPSFREDPEGGLLQLARLRETVEALEDKVSRDPMSRRLIARRLSVLDAQLGTMSQKLQDVDTVYLPPYVDDLDNYLQGVLDEVNRVEIPTLDDEDKVANAKSQILKARTQSLALSTLDGEMMVDRTLSNDRRMRTGAFVSQLAEKKKKKKEEKKGKKGKKKGKKAKMSYMADAHIENSGDTPSETERAMFARALYCLNFLCFIFNFCLSLRLFMLRSGFYLSGNAINRQSNVIIYGNGAKVVHSGDCIFAIIVMRSSKGDEFGDKQVEKVSMRPLAGVHVCRS